MADLSALRELYAWMVEARVSYAKHGELELRLESLPASRAETSEPQQPSDDEVARSNLDDLLYSSGADPEPFVRALRRVK